MAERSLRNIIKKDLFVMKYNEKQIEINYTGNKVNKNFILLVLA